MAFESIPLETMGQALVRQRLREVSNEIRRHTGYARNGNRDWTISEVGAPEIPLRNMQAERFHTSILAILKALP